MRVIRSLVSASLVIGGLLLLPATAASAHDGLVDSSPAADETVTAELTEVTLTFSDVPLPGAPAVIQVTDAAGETVTDGDVTATDRSLSVTVEPTSAGVYSVVWQVVSSDAHTISGDYTFTYAGPVVAPSPSASAPAVSPTPGASVEATPEPSPSDAVTSTGPADTENASGTSAPAGAFLPLIIAVLAAVVIAVVAAVYRANSARKQGTGSGGDPRA